MHISQGHQAVMPYLIVNGAAQFMDFVKTVFGAEVTMQHFRDETKTVMHAEVTIQGSTIMFADATPQFEPQVAGLFVYVDDADVCFHKALAAGAVVVTDLSDQEYGRTCGVKDPAGNTWWITSVASR